MSIHQSWHFLFRLFIRSPNRIHPMTTHICGWNKNSAVLCYFFSFFFAKWLLKILRNKKTYLTTDLFDSDEILTFKQNEALWKMHIYIRIYKTFDKVIQIIRMKIKWAFFFSTSWLYWIPVHDKIVSYFQITKKIARYMIG